MRARGGVVGLNDGGEPATEEKGFFDKMKDAGIFMIDAMSKTTAGVPPSLAFVDKDEVTPEDIIGAGALIQLQPLVGLTLYFKQEQRLTAMLTRWLLHTQMTQIQVTGARLL